MKAYFELLAHKDDEDIEFTIGADSREDGGYKFFSGNLQIGNRKFDLVYGHKKIDENQKIDENPTIFASRYRSLDGDRINIGNFVSKISPEAAGHIPSGFEIELRVREILFAFIRRPKETKLLFGLVLGASFDLCNLPLVGKKFPEDQTVGVENLQVLVAPNEFSSEDPNEVEMLNDAIKELPGDAIDLPGESLQRKLAISAWLRYGKSRELISFAMGGEEDTDGEKDKPQNSALQAASPGLEHGREEPSSPDDGKWFNLQKKFGPVYFKRVGVQYQDEAVMFLLDASLSMASLTLSLDGLSFGSSIKKFEPKFDLHGLGIDYKNDQVEIDGAFLRSKYEIRDESTGQMVTIDEYTGTAVIRIKEFSLSAIGSYTELRGHPSLFIYAVSNDPIGGPSFFFVTGLAAGFGYNRALKMPGMDQVARFPLVDMAVKGIKIDDIHEVVDRFHQYMPPAVGEYFLAVGIKFTSFKQIDSFALLTVSFGNRLEIDLLGLSRLVVPTPEAGKAVTPLAEVKMALKARFIPDEGFLGISAQLTADSYLLSKKCQLTGGFAFYCWFSGQHAGDFVITLGGYHPNFRVPAHYPKVPRLGFNWKVDSHISIKGDAYFALTSHALMAGGHLEATWHSGSLKAWFKAGADFLISWKPYHYEARAYVDMGVSYTYHFFGTHHISVHVGADLQIWGPEFSGKAHIHLWIVSFNVAFGSSASMRPQPIPWETFKGSFLPADDGICGISIKDGLVRTIVKDGEEIWVVNPKHLSLVTNSVIPIKEAEVFGEKANLGKANGDFGIAPMALGKDAFESICEINISYDNNTTHKDDFNFVPVLKNVPAGMWGESLKPEVNGQGFIENALSGFEITPGRPPTPGKTHSIERSVLQNDDPDFVNDKAHWNEDMMSFNEEDAKRDDSKRKKQIQSHIADEKTVKARLELLRAIGFKEEDISLDNLKESEESVDYAFLFGPHIGSLNGSKEGEGNVRH